MRSSRTTLTRVILERVEELGEIVIGSFFPSNYAQARMWRNLLGSSKGSQFSKATFSGILSRLQSRGLVERHGSKQYARWRITPTGQALLRSEQAQERDRRPTSPDGIQRIVIFDIPEKERRKRTAIRQELVAADFQPLQKSVWLGLRPLPKNFIELVDALDLSSCIHIFSVREKGTIGAAK